MKEPEEKNWQEELEELQAKVDLLKNQLKKLQNNRNFLRQRIKSSGEKKKKEPGK